MRLSVRDIVKRARRIGVKEEYIWMWDDTRLLKAKNVEDEKEIAKVDHYTLAVENGMKKVDDENHRGFVTFYINDEVEVSTYGIPFSQMPTRVQDRVEGFFGIKPGGYKEAVIYLPRGFTQVMTAIRKFLLSLLPGEVPGA